MVSPFVKYKDSKLSTKLRDVISHLAVAPRHATGLIPFLILRAAAPQRTHVVAAAVFTVEAKQNSLKRQRTTEKARLYNKSRKSEIATRMKKVSDENVVDSSRAFYSNVRVLNISAISVSHC